MQNTLITVQICMLWERHLYHLLTNQIPFAGETFAEIATAKENGRFKSARLINNPNSGTTRPDYR